MLRIGWRRDFGQVLGYASSVFYLGSRVSQIVRNWRRHSAEGLSLAMFGCAIAANVTYGSGILLRTYTWQALRASTPWILGSLGTVSLDVVIFCQVPTRLRAYAMAVLSTHAWRISNTLTMQLTSIGFSFHQMALHCGGSVWSAGLSAHGMVCRQITTGGARMRPGVCWTPNSNQRTDLVVLLCLRSCGRPRRPLGSPCG